MRLSFSPSVPRSPAGFQFRPPGFLGQLLVPAHRLTRVPTLEVHRKHMHGSFAHVFDMVGGD